MDTGKWIRPVSSRPDEEISDLECVRPNGAPTRLLDIARIPLIEPRPYNHQTENHLINARQRWRRIRIGTWDDVLENLDDHEGPLWLNEGASWGYCNNRIEEEKAARLRGSLLLIQPERLQISVGRKGGMYADRNKRLVKAHFRHSGFSYTLQVTDPTIEEMMWDGEDRTEDMDGAILCISLGEEYRGYVYKLVASVIRPN